MAALISKPGITNASTLSIPQTWDPTWMRSFINNQLTGADVRNAVGSGGIVVSGTIASPYATIGFGAPVTLPGPVTISAPTSATPALTVNANGSNPAIQLSSGYLYVAGTGIQQIVLDSVGVDYGVIANPSSQVWALGYNASLTNSVAGFTPVLEWTPTPQILGRGPTAGAMVDMTPDTGSFTATGVGFSGTAPTATINWVRMGNIVIMYLGQGNALTGTSNTTGLSFTGVPAELQPSNSGVSENILPSFAIEDNSVTGQLGCAEILSGSSTITFLKASGAFPITFGAANFTASGTKGLTSGWTFIYALK
jgi:hypothetical protein